MTPPDDRAPRLIWTEAGEPRSDRYGDVYFSAQDGLAESRTVFLQGCGLPNAWADRNHFTVAELGFGTGLNIVALLDLWRRTRPDGARLQVFTVEGHPLSVADAGRALHAWPALADISAALLAGWPPQTPGFHRIDLPDLGAVIDVAVGEVEQVLSDWSGPADVWFLDGFSPALNPAMWSDAVLDLIAARSAPDARLATFTVAGAVRRGLAHRGFVVDKRPGHGRKRERLEGRLPGPPPACPPSPSIVVVGAGIAGASVVRALRAAGLSPRLIEAEGPGAGASGFPAALVTPRFDLGDPAIAGLFAQTLERADALYSQVPGAILARSVLQLPATERDAARFDRIAAQPLWLEGALRPVDCARASTRAGEALDDPGLDMTTAFTLAPAAVLTDWLAGTPLVPGRADRIEPAPGGWCVRDAQGAPLAELEVVVVCAGAGTVALLPDLVLSPVRGQADWVSGITAPALAWGGYVAPTADGLLFGATHDRDQTATDVRPEDSARNRATLAARLPELAARLDPSAVRSRAALRATTRDRLPVVGPIPDQPGLFVLGGLGSRGHCLAPLLAEHLVAEILAHPSPLPRAVVDRLSPARPVLRPVAQPEQKADAVS
ncbi:tRNA (5-methylaminomethyl-2-thiouridine)(34)-methyltransferase MnmD [Brevundimonas sp. R86498]|uniref:tRNA (5-methylaminomethyl-2-thiouridine)(34)-methyltransferase MnmD n=1 Tax=Brevundimonas sp. R86498 TaxID=3093845 RepID=UPI0037CB1605